MESSISIINPPITKMKNNHPSASQLLIEKVGVFFDHGISLHFTSSYLKHWVTATVHNIVGGSV